MNFVFATSNKHKVAEVQKILGGDFTIQTMQEAGFEAEIPEPHATLEENATEKSATIYRALGVDCFSEDTGLEVEALNYAPGVRSARYAGEEADARANILLLLRNLEGIENRKARFRTVFSLMLNGKEYLFEGICPGHILRAQKGSAGFGYDPVFVPNEGDGRSFAEMTLEEKGLIGHRGKALRKLVLFLKYLEAGRP